jgi:DNA-binding CsgD family transcriptional regulator
LDLDAATSGDGARADEPAHDSARGGSTRRRGAAAPPDSLVASVFQIGPDQFAVLSYALVPVGLPSGLSVAEREVIRGILEGKSNGQIARERGRSVRTVANQVASVFRKLGVTSRSELAARCTRLAARVRG